MTDPAASALRKIVALCGDIPGHPTVPADTDAFIVMQIDHIIAQRDRAVAACRAVANDDAFMGLSWTIPPIVRAVVAEADKAQAEGGERE